MTQSNFAYHDVRINYCNINGETCSGDALSNNPQPPLLSHCKPEEMEKISIMYAIELQLNPPVQQPMMVPDRHKSNVV